MALEILNFKKLVTTLFALYLKDKKLMINYDSFNHITLMRNLSKDRFMIKKITSF